MPTPVGPAPRDPNDPDFWDWSGEDDGYEPRARRPGVWLVAVVLLITLVFMLIVGRL